VGIILIENRERFPEWFQKEIEEMASVSRWLRREREPSMYGDEEMGLPPQRLYTRNYAEKAYVESSKVVDLVSRLIGGLSSGDSHRLGDSHTLTELLIKLH
jgi:HEPN domain-containing protein